MPKAPESLTIRTYAVGFGDCFLLSFSYRGGETRHVLIDFGSTAAPKDAPSGQLLKIAKDIKATTGNRLDAIVATHRHADHINGFATNDRGTAPGDVIRSLRPKLVVQPWTEDPKAQKDATKPTASSSRSERNLLSVLGLDRMHDVALAADRAGRIHRPLVDPELADQLSFIGQDNLKNLSAVKNLMTMPGARHEYLAFGSKSRLGALLPGVTVHVLGPPTIDQHSSIRSQRDKDPDEFWRFWMRQGLASERSVGTHAALFAKEILSRVPPSLRWFRQRMAQVYGEELLSLVRILDKAMNNTSVILLFEIGSHRLLFPGDAQIENWEYALSKPDLQALVAGATLYKVGHHGSLNATPKRALWSRFKNLKGTKGPRRLATLLSTREDKHGHLDKGTEVPRRTLVKELERKTNHLSTLDFKPSELFRDVTIAF